MHLETQDIVLPLEKYDLAHKYNRAIQICQYLLETGQAQDLPLHWEILPVADS